MLGHHPPRAPERAFWSWRQVLRLRADRWECCSPQAWLPDAPIPKMTNGDPIRRLENGPQHLRVSIAGVEIAELRGDLQGKVPTGQPRGPRKLLVPVMGRRPRRERSPGRIREQQGHSQGWKGPMSKWPHTKTGCGVASDCGVCVRERETQAWRSNFKNLQPLSPSEDPPFSLQPRPPKKIKRERERESARERRKTKYLQLSRQEEKNRGKHP